LNAASNGTVRIGDERYVMMTGGVLLARHDGTYMSRLTLHNVTERHTGLYICSCSPTDNHGFNYLGAYLRVMAPRISESTLLLSEGTC